MKYTNEIYDTKLLEGGIIYKRLGDYIDTNTKIEHECPVCGHTWLVIPKSIIKGIGCPSCVGKLKYTNETYDTKLVEKGSKAKRIGEYINNSTKIEHECTICGHTWLVVPKSILKGIGCPSCSGKLKYTNESYDAKLVEKGSKAKRIGEYINSSTKIEHECTVCGHTWLAIPAHIISGRGCPYCAGTLKYTNETYDAKLLEKDIKYKRIGEYVNSKGKIEHECPKCNHTWFATPNNTLRGYGCPYCGGTLRLTNEVYDAKLTEKGIEYKRIGEYKSMKTKTEHECLVCGHIWSPQPHNLLHGTGCPKCAPTKGTSAGEENMAEFVKSIYSGWVELNDRSILEGKELDIVIPDLGIAFEYNGTYWHQEKFKGKNYHLDKTEAVESFGYRLIHVNENEWLEKQEIVKSRIKSLLGLSTRIYARKCTIKSVDNSEANTFLENNHVQGTCASKYKLGLYLEEDLIAIMTFGIPRFNKAYSYELIRYCSKLDYTVIGGASKLLKAFTKEHPGSIISYADRRWSVGDLYKTLGFKFTHNSEPNYKYYKGAEVLSRHQCQKHKLVEQGYDPLLTEGEIMDQRGYHKVFDCGSSVWVLETK